MITAQTILKRMEDIFAETEERQSLGTVLGGDADKDPTSLQRVDLLTRGEAGEADGGAPIEYPSSSGSNKEVGK